MNKIKSLAESNPHLQDVSKRYKLIARSVRSSCGVEGITFKKSIHKIKHRTAKRIYARIRPSQV